MKFKIVLLTTVFSLALFTTMIQSQPIYAEPSNQSDPVLKKRLMKQYGLTPHEEMEPYHSHSDYGISKKVDKNYSYPFLLTTFIRLYCRF